MKDYPCSYGRSWYADEPKCQNRTVVDCTTRRYGRFQLCAEHLDSVMALLKFDAGQAKT